MAQPTKSTAPTGGVVRPRPRFIIMIMPNCTGSTPIAVTGQEDRVVIRISAAMSITVPSSSRQMLMSRRMTIGWS